MSDIPSDEQRRVRWVLNWIDGMVQKYGGIVYEKGAKKMDWGQALARECYGKEWISLVPECPTWDDIHRAQEWELGKIPNWVDMKK